MRFVYGRLGRVRMRVLKQEPESFLFFFFNQNNICFRGYSVGLRLRKECLNGKMVLVHIPETLPWICDFERNAVGMLVLIPEHSGKMPAAYFLREWAPS